MYSVDRVDVTPDMEIWADWTAMGCAAPLAHCYISSRISTVATLYQVRRVKNPREA